MTKTYNLSSVVYIQPTLGIIFHAALLAAIHQLYAFQSHQVLEILQSNPIRQLLSMFLPNQNTESAINTLAHAISYWILYVAMSFIVICYIAHYVIRIAQYAKTSLILDERGIWLEKGLFNFTRERHGIEWVNSKLCTPSNNVMYHWLKNHKVIIQNRYSSILELSTPPIRNGKQAIKEMNEMIEAKTKQ